jgi:hypothetical protein
VPPERGHLARTLSGVSDAGPVTHEDLIAQNRRTSIIMLVSEFLLIGTLGGLIGLLITR